MTNTPLPTLYRSVKLFQEIYYWKFCNLSKVSNWNYILTLLLKEKPSIAKIPEVGYKSSRRGIDHICCSYTNQSLTSDTNYDFYSFQIKNNVIQTLKIIENVRKCKRRQTGWTGRLSLLSQGDYWSIVSQNASRESSWLQEKNMADGSSTEGLTHFSL